ncbi:MAG TPA: hypothetical protein DD733_10530, partial [Clostridiales bacterium]|nr:hypothetical protein [Clostridiales bacterium]
MKKKIIPPGRIRVREKVMSAAGGNADYSFDFNLYEKNEYIYGAAVINGGFVYILIENSNKDNDTEIKLTIDDVTEFRYINNSGCVAIEYTKSGEDFELCRSDMRNAVAMQI